MPPETSGARAALIAIATLLAPDSPRVGEEVASAFDDPDGYVATHAERLEERGIDDTDVEPGLPWIVLVNALTDHGLLAEVDWKESAEEIVAELRELRSQPARPDAWAWLDGAGDDDLATYDFLEVAARELRASGTALVHLDIVSDCYPLVFVPADRAGELAELATVAGYEADLLGQGGG
ncbi:MAG: DUF6630 family protein [Mycobacteriales bacterium]